MRQKGRELVLKDQPVSGCEIRQDLLIETPFVVPLWDRVHMARGCQPNDPCVFRHLLPKTRCIGVINLLIVRYPFFTTLAINLGGE